MEQEKIAYSDGVPLARTIDEVSQFIKCGRTTIYAEIREGNLKARKLRGRTLILEEDLRQWLASLPALEVA